MKPRSVHVSITVTVAAAVLLSALYFEVHAHFWFQGFVRSNAITTLHSLFFGGLLLIALLRHGFIKTYTRSWIRTGPGRALVLALVLFTWTGGSTLAIHETGWDEFQRFLFYLYAPMGVMISTVIIHPTDRAIRTTLWALFVSALLFSAYSTSLHVRGWSGEDMAVVYRSSHSDPLIVARESVPGLGGNQFPSMLVPMILTGVYFSQRLTGGRQLAVVGGTTFLFFNMLITASRGALLSLAVGLLYLVVRHWYRINARVVLLAVPLLGIFYVSGDFVTQRFEQSILGGGMEGYERLSSLQDSLVFYFVQNPLVGAGFTYFQTSQGPRIGETDHNVYSGLLAGGGLLVVVPLVLILFLIYRNTIRMIRRCRDDHEAAMLGTYLAAGFVAHLVDMNFAVGLFLYYSVWWGLLVAWGRNVQMRQFVTAPSSHQTGIAQQYRARSLRGLSQAYRQ